MRREESPPPTPTLVVWEIQQKIAQRARRCSVECRGWRVAPGPLRPNLEPCEACWTGVANPLTVEEVRRLPEPWEALRLAALEIMTVRHLAVGLWPEVASFRVKGGRVDWSGAVFHTDGTRVRVRRLDQSGGDENLVDRFSYYPPDTRVTWVEWRRHDSP